MPSRKLSLEEWFLIYQLTQIKKNHFHLPLSLETNITKLVESAGRDKIPFTAILIKAVALTLRDFKAFNRLYFKTFFGQRIIEFENASVNVPLTIDFNGHSYVGATVIKNADHLSISKIQELLKVAKSQDIKKMLIGRHIVGRSNCFFNRIKLRLFHAFLFRCSKIHERHGGGATVSSLMNFREIGFHFVPHPFGHNALTVSSATVEKNSDNQWIWYLGLGVDHQVLTGSEITEGIRILNRHLKESCFS